MEKKKKIVPTTIFCPKCGETVKIKEEKNTLALKQLSDKGYIAAGNGSCDCGVVLAIVVQEMPKSPTFTIMFDVYEKGGE